MSQLTAPRSNLIERSSLAANALLSGDPLTALRGATNPLDVSPAEQQSWAERYLGLDPGPLASAVTAATSPMVLVGLALTLKYPVLKASSVLEFGDKIKKYASTFFPGMKFLADFNTTFGEPLASLMENAVRTTHIRQLEGARLITRALEDYESKAGPLTRGVGSKIAAKLDGLDSPDHPAWAFLRKKVPGADSIVKGLPTITLTGPERVLSEDLRAIMKSQFEASTKNLQSRDAVVRGLQKLGFDPNTIEPVAGPYWPHIEKMTRETLRKRHQEWLESLSDASDVVSGEGARRRAAGAPLRQASRRMVSRTGIMIPDERDLKAAGFLTPDLEKLYHHLDSELEMAGAPYARRYGLDAVESLKSYNFGMARQAAWVIPPEGATRSVGEKVADELKLLVHHNPTKANMLKDTYIPMVTGQLSWEASVPSQLWSQRKDAAATWIRGAKWIPEGLKKGLLGPLEESQSLSWQKSGNAIARYFYGSTLAFNALSPAKNLLQTLSTTVPVIGPKYTVAGIKRVLTGLMDYRKMKLSGIDKAEAFAKVFPEFSATGFDLGGDPWKDIESLIERGMGDIKVPSRAGKALDWAQSKALWLFTGSERFNRLTAFYGAHAKAMDELPGTMFVNHLTDAKGILKSGTDDLRNAAVQVADRITHMTQFGGGPLATPYGTINWWKPFSQYTLFPLRMLGFLAGPGTHQGGKLNLGILGRAALTGGLAYEAGKYAGIDISAALVTGSIPEIPSEDRPFSPFPLVAPFAQVVGSGLSAIQQGDIHEFSKSAPLLVPGGVALSKLLPTLAPGVSKALGKTYADYTAPTPDGRVAVMAPSGSLIGYYSPIQLLAKSIGLGDIAGSHEQALMGYLMHQRDRIRGYRREYLEAISGGDMGAAKSVQSEYEAAYPGMGGIALRKSDIKTVQLRRTIPRLEQLLSTVAPEQRDQLAAVIATSFAGQGESLLGSDPGAWGRGTPVSRRTQQLPGAVGLEGASNALDISSLRATAVGAGQQRRDEMTGFPAFTGF